VQDIVFLVDGARGLPPGVDESLNVGLRDGADRPRAQRRLDVTADHAPSRPVGIGEACNAAPLAVARTVYFGLTMSSHS
jgi:hypothetical protein